MTNKNKLKQIIAGIFSSAFIWGLSILLSGVIVGGDLLDLGYSELGLGRIFFILFLGYNIFIALYSTKTNKKYYWKGAFITEIIPLISLLLCWIQIGDSSLAGYIIYPFSALPFLLCTPVGGLMFAFPDDNISSIIATIIGFMSPIISLVIYKIKYKRVIL
ncbi:MAG: hypothetical protein IKK46_08335 [Clostridia bacterium]|nr:hypothetical protein [Clostridia bacterium]